MSRKSILKPDHIIVDGDMTSDITSEVVDVQWLDRIAVQLSFTGTAIGSFYVQTSLNYDPILDAGNWISLDLSPAPVANGTANDILIDITVTAAPYLRIFYDASSGTGTLNAYVSGKMS